MIHDRHDGSGARLSDAIARPQTVGEQATAFQVLRQAPVRIWQLLQWRETPRGSGCGPHLGAAC